jgi:UDP-2,4-diacetamido-2,4,6-trideoxy-beta-L-altropyranose hydrolase
MATIVFRTTAGKQIGFGHLRRCLTLAGELGSAGRDAVAISFWIDGDPSALSTASAAGFDARTTAGPEPETTVAQLLSGEIETLITDSYSFSAEMLATWRRSVGCLVALDDLADRFLDVDVLINGSPHAAALSYRTNPATTRLLGPQYAMLRPSFRDLPRRPAPATVSRVLVTLGGADPQGSTTAVVAAVRRTFVSAHIDVVVGPLFGPVPDLDRAAAHDPEQLTVHRNLDDLVALMAATDLAVTGGGQTLYELAASGVPAVALCLADNQEGNVAALDGVSLLSAGSSTAAAAGGFSVVGEVCRRLGEDRPLRERLSRAGQALVDGRGAARVADVVLKTSSGRGRRPVDHG